MSDSRCGCELDAVSNARNFSSIFSSIIVSVEIQNTTRSHKRKKKRKETMIPIRDNSSCATIGIPMDLFTSLDSLMRLPTTSPPPINARLFRVNDTEAMTEERRRRGSPKDKESLVLDVINAALAVLKEARTRDERQPASMANASIPH